MDFELYKGTFEMKLIKFIANLFGIKFKKRKFIFCDLKTELMRATVSRPQKNFTPLKIP